MTYRPPYTVAEAAQILGVTAGHLYRLCRAGDIRTVSNIGRRVLIPRHVVEEMLGLT